MKVNLEFNLPEDVDDWNIHKNVTRYYMALEDIRIEIRRILKYEPAVSEDAEIYLRNLQLLIPEDL